MSSKQTEHLALHAWEPEDMFMREEFNANFAAIDGEAGALRAAVAAAQAAAEAAQRAADAAQAAADTAQSTADTAQDNANGRLRIQTGFYDGTGAIATKTKPITIPLDFRPELIFMFPKSSKFSSGTYSGKYYIQPNDGSTINSSYTPPLIIFSRTMDCVYMAISSSSSYAYLFPIWGDNSFGFYGTGYSGTSDSTQTSAATLNESGKRYYWIAIGQTAEAS